MVTKMYAKCSWNGQTFMLFMRPELNCSNVVHDVFSCFGLRTQVISMTFSLPNYLDCALSNDMDLKLMMISMAML